VERCGLRSCFFARYEAKCERMKTSERSRRLAGVVMQELPPILQKILTPNQVGFLTVTAIDISGDCGIAEVYLDALSAPADWMDALNKVKPKIVHTLLTRVKMRREMVVIFKKDLGIDHAKVMHDKLK
jgi:ribosome-binding factor A